MTLGYRRFDDIVRDSYFDSSLQLKPFNKGKFSRTALEVCSYITELSIFKTHQKSRWRFENHQKFIRNLQKKFLHFHYFLNPKVLPIAKP